MSATFDTTYNTGTGAAAAAAPQPAPAPEVIPCSEFARLMLGFQPDEKQRQILDSTAPQGLLNCCRQWGKSTVMAIKAVYYALHHPNSTVMIASPSARQSREMMRKCKDLVRTLGMKPRGDGDNKISLQFRNGSRIVGLPGRSDTVRSFTASLIFIDEAAWVKDEMFLALSPMLATTNGALWMMSTPNGSRGMFWQAWQDGGAAWERYEAPAQDCPRIRPEFLAREKRRMGEQRFAQEYGCTFVDNNECYFRRTSLEAALTHDYQPWDLHPKPNP